MKTLQRKTEKFRSFDFVYDAIHLLSYVYKIVRFLGYYHEFNTTLLTKVLNSIFGKKHETLLRDKSKNK